MWTIIIIFIAGSGSKTIAYRYNHERTTRAFTDLKNNYIL